MATGGSVACGKSPTGTGGVGMIAGRSVAGAGGGDGSAAGGGVARPVDGGCALAGIGFGVLLRCRAVSRRAAGWRSTATARGLVRRARGTAAAARCAGLGSTVRPSIRTGEGPPTSRVLPSFPGASASQLQASSIRPHAPSVPTTGRAPVRYAGLITGEAKGRRSPLDMRLTQSFVNHSDNASAENPLFE
jgi:hypothetical protein